MPEQKPPPSRREIEHLANERTFLAWVRTSVAVITLGFLVARFSLWFRQLSSQLGGNQIAHERWHAGASLPIGQILMAFGVLMVIFGARRYGIVSRAIEHNEIKADRALVILVTVVVSVLAAIMIVYMFFVAER